MKRVSDNRENKELIKQYHDFYEENSQYRKKAFDNMDSNYGWYTCPRCRGKFRKGQLDVDHIVPKSKGGDNSRYNLQVMCPHCNRSKQNDMNDTYRDLERRRRELAKQDKADLDFLNRISKKR